MNDEKHISYQVAAGFSVKSAERHQS